MKNYITLMISLAAVMLFLTGCKGNEEKIIEAQKKYQTLLAIHNQVVEAHDGIANNSLDKELNIITGQMSELTQYNLYEMTDEEMDILIETMDIMNESYSNYLKTIGEIKVSEDAAFLKPILFSLENATDMTFISLTLMERGETDLVSNALESSSGLDGGQVISGLTIYADADNTPWIMTLIKTDGVSEEGNVEYKFTIDPLEMNDNGTVLVLIYDPETNSLNLEKREG